MRKRIIRAERLNYRYESFINIYIVLDGNCSVKKFNKRFDYTVQDVFFISPNTLYSIEGKCILGNIEIDLSDTKDLELVDGLDSMDLKKDITNTYRDCIFISNLLSLFESNIHYPEVIEALLSDYNLLNNYHHHLITVSSSQSKLYYRIIKYIKENYRNKISLDELANEAGVQKNYLCALFKDMTDMTIHEYVTIYRLKIAQYYLLKTKMSNNEIIESCGFSDRKYFYRYFQEYFGHTPLDYLKTINTNDNDIYSELKGESLFYLDRFKNELEGLDTNTYFYEKFMKLNKHKDYHELKDEIVELDLLNQKNYLLMDDEKINTWYGFDLINKFVYENKINLELVFNIEKNTSYKQIDEVMLLLDKSAQSIEKSALKYWHFVLSLNDSSSYGKAEYLKERLSSVFRDISIKYKI